MEFVFPIFIILLFSMFIIRPQILRKKRVKKFQKDLVPGQEVITSSGILGKILRIHGSIVIIKVDENTNIRILKTHIISEFI